MPIELELNNYKDTVPFRLVNKLGVPLYIEKSFKVAPGELTDRRYLVGIYKKYINEDIMISMCREMNMPEDFLEIFVKSQAQAGGFGIGYQEKDSERIYKVYLDFFDKVMLQARIMPNPNRPAKMNVGFKWNPEKPNSKIISTYHCYPMITVSDIKNRLKNLYSGIENKNSLEAIYKILDLASTKVEGDDLFIYLEASEKGTLRKSFDINLIQANLPTQEATSLLTQLFEHFSISQSQYEDVFQQIESKTLGHLSGGIDMAGTEFLTVYVKMS